MDDKFDPRGWVTIRKTDMELLEEANGQKAAKGPQSGKPKRLCFRPFSRGASYALALRNGL